MTLYKYAGFWRRFIAYTIDGFIISIIFVVLAIIAGIAFFAGTMSGGNNAWIAEMSDPAANCIINFMVLAFFTFDKHSLLYLFSRLHRTYAG